MFLRTDIPTEMELQLIKMFDLYSSEILTLQGRWWADEDRYGESTKQYDILRYYTSFLYAILFDLETKEGFSDYCDIKTKFDYDTIKECLACKDIDLDAIFAIMGYPPTSGDGIEFIGIEITFEIEPDEVAEAVERGDGCALDNLGNGSINFITGTTVNDDTNEESNSLPDAYVLEV